MPAILQITLRIVPDNRPAAVAVFNKYRDAFLKQVPGAQSKQLLVRPEDVQVLHGFVTAVEAEAYLQSRLFTNNVVGELEPLLADQPDIRIYEVVAG